MFDLVPKKIFLTKGVGFSKERLASFEQALQDAGISHLNLVEVSSILPRDAKLFQNKRVSNCLCLGRLFFVF